MIQTHHVTGDGEIRTLDPLLARQVLSQLSYTPMDAGLPFVKAIPTFLFSVCLLNNSTAQAHVLKQWA